MMSTEMRRFNVLLIGTLCNRVLVDSNMEMLPETQSANRSIKVHHPPTLPA